MMSSYAKSKHCIADFEMELEAAISELKELRKYCKRMIFIEGNHENRLFKLIQNNCPQIMRIDFASCIASYLKLSDINIEFIPFDSEQFFMPWENVRFGIQHAPPDQGRHCARNTLDKNQVSTLFGHCHRTMTSA
jgi:hypothetical protein